MRCHIIGAAPNSSIAPLKDIKKQENDLIICADGGLDYAKAAGLSVDFAVGDFDSLCDKTDLGDCQIFEYDKHKDDTDTKLAVKRGMERGGDEFLLYCCTGGRFDHMYANILLLLWLKKQGFRASLIDDEARYYFIDSEHTFENTGRRTVSLFAIGGPVKGITLTGLEYPLTDYNMSADDSIGTSNVIICENAVVDIKSGYLLVVEYNREF